MSQTAPKAHVRLAETRDLDAVVLMTESRRIQYQEYQPVFWRKAKDSTEQAYEFLEKLLTWDKAVFLVSEQAGKVNGFLVATEVKAPPVYDPQGATYQVDDFCVISPDLWLVAGRPLLAETRRRVRERGAVQIVVVCGDRDIAKAELLRREKLSIASNWWTQPLCDRPLMM
ncbi:N-acetyltransferase [Nisaea nitritireducens]|uniref:N-acetyltransferase n=1 Tax=Nisaea nitritireducens TaxID=568392 RepID=UPI001868AD6A|nr:N-acetyltransferase [Nisaea nitritireducens]